MFETEIEKAQQRLADLLRAQLERVDHMKKDTVWIDYSSLPTIPVGLLSGDGIGPFIMAQTRRVLETLLADPIKTKRISLVQIEGLTIENRAAHRQAIPSDVLKEIQACPVLLKGPTTTPRQGDPWPNLESANVAMRKELDLFANVRPFRVPQEGIDWTFFRENTEGEYVLGSHGMNVTSDLAIDFKIITSPGTERIARLGFEYARKKGYKRVTIVTKANVVKTTDGKFLALCREIAKEYPDIECDDWYVDIMSAKLIDPKRRRDFRVIVLPNLYGDILTDEAAEIQGGVGTAGSANIGRRYAMFEAIHGSAPRMVDEGRAAYADPCSLMRAAAMLLAHIGLGHESRSLDMALDICCTWERSTVLTGRKDGASSEAFTDHLLEVLSRPALEKTWTRLEKES